MSANELELAHWLCRPTVVHEIRFPSQTIKTSVGCIVCTREKRPSIGITQVSVSVNIADEVLAKHFTFLIAHCRRSYRPRV